MYKNRKFLTFVGSIATTAIPVVAVVSCGSEEWRYEKDKKLFADGPTLSNFQKDINKINSSSGEAWKIIEKQAAFFYYDKEQQGSIKVQRDNFLWEKHNKEEEKDNLADNENNKDKIKNLNKDIANLEKKIKRIDDNNLDYDSSEFSTDYPEILLNIKQIKEKQEDIYDNEKDAFVKNYPTKKEGQAEWISEISKKYDGANTREEAIDNLVYNVIKENAFLRNNIKIDTSFTVKQLKWANTKEANGAFPFLNIDGYSGKSNVEVKDAINKVNSKTFLRVTGNDDDDKVYFYGSDSKIWGHKDEENLKLINENRLNEIIGKKDIYRMYRHALLNIRPNPKGRTLPWEVSIDEIKKLIALTPDQKPNNQSFQFERITNLWKDMDDFSSDVDQETSFFLNQVSDNSEGTKNIGGSLGVHEGTYFSNAMFDGFALGSLVIEKNDGIFNENDSIYSKLATEIEKAKNEIFALNSNTQNFNTNEEINEYIDSLNSDQVKNIFGKHIRDLFDPNALEKQNVSRGKVGRSLIYNDNDLVVNNIINSRFLFISTNEKGGIHLIKRYVVNGTALGQQTSKELEKMTKEEDTKTSQYNIAELITPLLTEEKLIQKTITNTKVGDGKELFEFIEKKIGKEIKIEDLEDQNITDTESLIDDAKKYIENQNVVKANEIASTITNAHSEYLSNALDNREIAYLEYDADGDMINEFEEAEILKPEDIYKIAYELAKKENEVI